MDTLNSDLLDILKQATISGNTVSLNCGELERETYLKLNTCLERLGGKWKGGKTKGHIFPSDPTKAIQAVLSTGVMPVDNPLAYFPTPSDLCKEILNLADIRPNTLVLEPSAGQGAIANTILATQTNITLHCVEFDTINKSILEQQGLSVVATDFLAYNPTTKYDYIVMNPPFTVDGDSRCDQTHIKHAYSLLSDKGTLVSITNGGWEVKNQKPYYEFRNWLSDKLTYYDYIPPNTFETTKIATRVIRLQKDNWRMKEYNGWSSYYAWEYVLMATNDQDSSDIFFSELPIEKVDEELRRLWGKLNYYISLPTYSKESMEEIESHRLGE